MKLFLTFLSVLVAVGFVVSPAMACDGDSCDIPNDPPPPPDVDDCCTDGCSVLYADPIIFDGDDGCGPDGCPIP